MIRKTKSITRREFVNGFAASLAAGTSISPLQAASMGLLAPEAVADHYPPSLQGMRGDHEGSFEVSHAQAWMGRRWDRPSSQTDDTYDLVVVGGGISGLSAAWFFREKHGHDAKVLILDNHDDFGGHATRNEFDVDGTTLIGYGGTQNIEGVYSAEATRLLNALAIDLKTFEKYFDKSLYSKHGLGEAVFFDSEFYGQNKLVPAPFKLYEQILKHSELTPADPQSAVSQMPISDESKQALLKLLDDKQDFLTDIAAEKKAALLASTSYNDFLRQHAKMPEEVINLLTNIWQCSYGASGDYWSAMTCAYFGYPGTAGLGIFPAPAYDAKPIINHFPDGNASVARLLVRSLIPASAKGTTMEDIVTARVDYAALDQRWNNTRIRLNSTVVNVVNTKNETEVEVTYVTGGKNYRVNAKHGIVACYNAMVRFICPELPQSQKEALDWPEKVPVAFTNVALRNWRAFKNLGVQRIYSPQSEFGIFWLDFPVSMGGYEFSQSPDQPIVMHIPYVPSVPAEGLTARQQYKASRYTLYQMSFNDFETKIFGQLDRMLSPGGFDASRDIGGITVNRWPHGYTHSYSDLFDAPNGIGIENGPHIAGRQQVGRISIANCDSHGEGLMQASIDAAHRAVTEQTTR
jgi:spermidine dehydrogenase